MIGRATRARLGVAAALLVALFAGQALAQQASDLIDPESAVATDAGRSALASRQMVVAANPLAAEAGLEVLRQGGSAADALVAVQATLGLVEPQSSGLGGGAFLVWYDARTRSVTTFDARETAPALATPDLFRDDSGKPLPFFEAVVGGRSVGVPGVPRLLEEVHRRYGTRPWPTLLAPAIDIADHGFKVSPRLASLIAEDSGRLDAQPTTRSYFFHPDGRPLAAGDTLKNPDYAATLRLLAADGARAFYEGPLAARIVEAVTAHPTNPGLLAASDLQTYRVRERTAVCAPYRGYDICGMGPPSSGGIAIGQILGMLAPFDLGALGRDDPTSWRLIGDATRLAFADRERYLADSDFVSIPKGLLDPGYLAARSALLRRPTALPDGAAQAGDPPWDKAELREDGQSFEVPSTSHFVITDAAGNVASMTTSVENAFGARLMVGGFLLNNQLTDFAFSPVDAGVNVANRVEPGKRPRSSMAPTLVLKDGRPAFALGSPGGSNIIAYVATTLIGLIDWRMTMPDAVAMPHLVNRFGPYDLEAGTEAEALADDLGAFGFATAVKDLNSGLHGIAWTGSGLHGAADPRREGVAIGD